MRFLTQLSGLGLLHVCTSPNGILKIQVTLDIASRRLVNRYRHFEGTGYFHLQVQAMYEEWTVGP
jgi:hypothetical protein